MKLLVHAHIFYPEFWQEIRTCLSNLSHYPCEVFVTTPIDDVVLKNEIRQEFPTCHFITAENGGYDIKPFLDVIHSINLSEFDYIAKIHTKRNLSCVENNLIFINSGWRHKLLSVFSNKSLLRKSLNLLESDSRIGMLAHPAVIFNHDDPAITHAADTIVKGIGLSNTSHRYVGGTMFLARTKALLPLLTNPPAIDEISIYAFERALGYTVEAHGYKIADPHNLLWLYESTYELREKLILLTRFLYRITAKRFMKGLPDFRQLGSSQQPCRKPERKHRQISV